MAKDFGLDAPRVTRDEAVELCIHHLRLAWMYFDVVPDDGNWQFRQEASRILADDPGALVAANVFAETALRYHEQLKEQDQ